MRPDIREDIPKINPRYEAYYGLLDLFDDGEYHEFWAALRRDLPNSFRFTGSKGQALPVQQTLKDRYIPEIISIKYDGENVTPPSPIAWYPDQLAWQMTTPKNIVRKFLPFAAFQKFLVSETSVGNISRQEVVSMIPPLLMDLKPSMTVLDMCAAPGSKAAQLIEMIHAGEEARMREIAAQDRVRDRSAASADHALPKQEPKDEEGTWSDWSDDGRSTGLVIANDSDNKRAHMLTHQMKRLNSPNLVVTNHDATMFPSIRLPSGNGPRKYLKFDRILADVPCSGDGTCRKNVNVWKDWTPGNALGLHPTQQRILIRALQMLKPGGRVVYSTCSMNPVENEAVVASAVDRCGGPAKVELVDCRGLLSGLARRDGLGSWKVMDKVGRIWSTWEEFEQADDRTGRLEKSMFSPSEKSIPLERCMRIYPHLQDTGAFFIAVLEKKSDIKARPEAESYKMDSEPSKIMDVVSEIQSRPKVNGHYDTEKIAALDSIAPPLSASDATDTSAASRQNQENTSGAPPTAEKRSLDAETDAYMSAKRPKVRDEVEDPAPQGSENRQVHWPPPPGAVLDASRPETTLTLPEPSVKSEMPMVKSENRQDSTNLNKRPNQPFEEPFKYLSVDYLELGTISAFYNISPRFPRDRFMVRNALGTATKTIYYTSALARDILEANASSGIKFVHCGVKMFVRQDVQSPEVCRWRIQNEGIPLLEAWIGEERIVKLYRRSTLRGLLVEMFPKIEGSGWDKLG